MKNILILIFVLFYIQVKSENKNIKVGAENLHKYNTIISGKKIGLLVNHTSTIKNIHLIDTLFSLNMNIQKIFSPEHGFKGKIERGKSIDDYVYKYEEKSIPIISMYGKKRIPNNEDLSGIEVMIFDIQDVGARFYTYISAMHNMMEKCAELGIKFLVLDRPNPNGDYVDGPVLDTLYQSYIGMHPIPIVHGCTVGELALMIKGERWIEHHDRLDMKVIKVKNWNHNDEYILPIKPSPNLPNQKSIRLYPSLCLFEQTVVSIGRGTEFPFQVIGHPHYKSDFNFTPISVSEESKPKLENILCYGIDLRNKKYDKKLNLEYLINFYNKLKDHDTDFFDKYFYRLAGNNILENQIKKGLSEDQIRLTWENEINDYKKIRKKYLLYDDFE